MNALHPAPGCDLVHDRRHTVLSIVWKTVPCCAGPHGTSAVTPALVAELYQPGEIRASYVRLLVFGSSQQYAGSKRILTQYPSQIGYPKVVIEPRNAMKRIQMLLAEFLSHVGTGTRAPLR